MRSESFENRNALGQGFIKSNNQLDPRLGASWDAFGTGRSRYFANLGRYHLPVATNTNVKIAGGELFTDAYYQCGPDGAAQACVDDPHDARPLNTFGVHPSDPDVASYGAVSFYQDGVVAARGSRDRTPWSGQLDLALKYHNAVVPGLSVSLDILMC